MLLVLSTNVAHSDEYRLFFDGYSDNYTESVPVVDFLGSWKGAKEYNKGDRAFSNSFTQMGVQYSQFSFATFYRYDYYLQMNPDVGEYRYLFHNKRDQLENKDYVYDFQEQRSTAFGLRFGYRTQASERTSLAVYTNFFYSGKFQVRDVRDGYINGKTRRGDGQVDYHFSRDTLFNLLEVQETPDGYGASLDFDIRYQISPNLLLDLSVKDLFHFIYFEQSPYAIGAFHENAFLYNDQNVLQQQPQVNIKTHEGGDNRSYTQRLPLRVSASLSQYFNHNYLVGVEYTSNEIFDSVTLKCGYKLGHNSELEFSYNLNSEAIGIHGSYRSFYFGLLTDTQRVGYANNLSVFVGLSVRI